jgi:hypothetical protein
MGWARVEVLVGGGAADASASQGLEGASIEVFPGIGRAHLEHDTAGADAHQGADFKQLEANGVDLGLGPFGAFQGQPPQGFDQSIGQRGEVQAQLIAFHLVGGEPIGEQTHLLLDAVLHLATGTVELLVQLLGWPCFGCQRSDHEARVLAFIKIFCLGHNAARVGPALVCLVLELGKDTSRFRGVLVTKLRLVHLLADDPAQSLAARQAEEIIGPIGFTPSHQFLTAEAGVSAQHDLYLGPARTQPRYDAAHFFHRTGRRILVGRPEPRTQQLITGEDVQGQIASSLENLKTGGSLWMRTGLKINLVLYGTRTRTPTPDPAMEPISMGAP